MDEDKFRRYLLYALGEILLVMIGILLALQVNNWNEKRKDRTAEINALEGLKQEFLNTKTIVEEKKQRVLFGIEKYSAFIQKMTRGTLQVEDYFNFEQIGSFNMGVNTTNPSFGVLNSLISSGEINLIRNDSLKYLLTDWKDRFADFTEDELIHINFDLEVFERFKMQQVPEIYNSGNKYSYADLSDDQVNQFHQKLLTDFRFRNYVILNKALIANLEPEIDKLLNRIQLILRLISQEIEK